jgi:hypothetical protein
MSTQPQALAKELLARLGPDAPSPVIHPTPEPGSGQGDDIPALVRVLDAVLPNAQPALQAALFDVASQWQGMHVESVTDPGGRPAIELWIVTEQRRVAWYFDPTNHQLLAFTEAYDGHVSRAMIVTRAAVVGGVGDTDVIRPLVASPTADLHPIEDPR